MVGAVTHPTRGTVGILGETLGRVDLRQLRTLLGHVNPRHPLHSPLRVSDAGLTGLTNSVEPVPRWSPDALPERAEADRLLSMLGMGKAEMRWPTLSQGERGRTLIARSLMPKPRLLLLDEPALTGLDLAAREQLLNALDTLRHNTRSWRLCWSRTISRNCPPPPPMRCCCGRAVCGLGPADDVLTTDRVSKCRTSGRIPRTTGGGRRGPSASPAA